LTASYHGVDIHTPHKTRAAHKRNGKEIGQHKKKPLHSIVFLLILPAVSSGQELHEEQLNKGIRKSRIHIFIKQAQAGHGKKCPVCTAVFSRSSRCLFEWLKASFSFRPERRWRLSIICTGSPHINGISGHSCLSSLLMPLLSFFLLLIAVVSGFEDIPLLSHDIQEGNPVCWSPLQPALSDRFSLSGRC
jgi:hypothetical protein